MARSQKQGKNGDAGLGEDCRRARRPRRRRTSLERCRKWPESGHAPSRAGAWVTGRRRRAARGGAWINLLNGQTLWNPCTPILAEEIDARVLISAVVFKNTVPFCGVAWKEVLQGCSSFAYSGPLGGTKMGVSLCREVEDFARRLNSDWPERMQEILSLGQQRRLVPISMNGNGSAHRYTSMSFF
ncbi:hypothetical protein CK203_019503 [Vitis vinifera]|uniref:Uncharacterized protein n=1 Tax=Vitis vinifera TaxID=29760 RepID=A0A438IYT5_VITVI|nr:hypothetical protein CK203_019503 [Vitis vinifera]